MSDLVKKDQWVWAIVQEPGKDESFLGQYDIEKEIYFIPVFRNNEEAADCLNYLIKDESKSYEAQAVLYEELCESAIKNKFMVFILNGSGEVLEKNLYD